MLPREHYLKQTFLDGVNFPNGFEKGGLSDIQARLIKKNGVLIKALTLDEVSDPSVDDLHILKVIANQTVPKSPVEQAWMKYLSIVEARQGDATSTKGKARSSKASPVTQTSIQQAILAATATRTAIVESDPAPKTTSKTAKKTPSPGKKSAKAAVATSAAPSKIVETKEMLNATATPKKADTPTEPKTAVKKVVGTKESEKKKAAKAETKKTIAKAKSKNPLTDSAEKELIAPKTAAKKTSVKVAAKEPAAKKTTPAKATSTAIIADAKTKKAAAAKPPKAASPKAAEKSKKMVKA